MITPTLLTQFIQRLKLYWLLIIVVVVVALVSDVFIFHVIHTSQIPHTSAAAVSDLYIFELLNILRILVVLLILYSIYLLIIRPMTQQLNHKTQAWANESQRRHEIELALRESEARYRLLAENATDMISRHDAEGHCLYVTSNCLALTGYTAEETLGISAHEFFHPDDVPHLDAIHAQVLATPETVFRLQYRLQHRDGHYLWVEATLKSIWNAAKDGLEIIAISRDISDTLLMQQQLQDKERFIRRVLQAIPDVVYVQDILGNQTLYSNRSLYDLLGYHPEDIAELGIENFTQLMPNEDLMRLPLQWAKQRQATDDDVIEFEYRLKNKQADWVWVRSRELVFERDKLGIPRQILTTLQDMTEEKRAAQQQVQLEMERQQRSMIAEFIQNASHDFRTPLTIISNNAYLMSRSDDAAKRADKAANIQKQIQHLEKLLDDILLMTELDVESVLRSDKVAVNTLIRDHLVGMKTTHTIQFHADEGQLWVLGNPVLLDKALKALLRNAQTHTPPDGSIRISTHYKAPYIEIAIHNTGDIIPPEVLPHIFDRFYRGDTGRSPGKGGMGLGLTITQKIIQQHKGSITAESNLETGTTFRICLPAV